MSDDFFRTRMGHQFFQSTLPKLVDEVGRLADNIAALNATLASRPDAREGVGPGPVKACIKCGAEIVDPQLEGDERCAGCGDGP